MEGTGNLHIQRWPDGSYLLVTKILLDRDIDEVFEFFSDPFNLSRITPSWLGLRIRPSDSIRMALGTRIRYRFRVRHVPAAWHSKITAWEPPNRFVDEQRRGPFTRWVHEHTFETVAGGTLATDTINYAVPGGRLVHSLFVARDLKRLFAYRHQKLKTILEKE